MHPRQAACKNQEYFIHCITPRLHDPHLQTRKLLLTSTQLSTLRKNDVTGTLARFYKTVVKQSVRLQCVCTLDCLVDFNRSVLIRSRDARAAYTIPICVNPLRDFYLTHWLDAVAQYCIMFPPSVLSSFCRHFTLSRLITLSLIVSWWNSRGEIMTISVLKTQCICKCDESAPLLYFRYSFQPIEKCKFFIN